MLIDQLLPRVIAERSSLRERLAIEGATREMAHVEVTPLIAQLPDEFLNAGAFLDRLTSIWRYEFGMPFDIASNHYWGTHMWVPVTNLFVALECAAIRLEEQDFTHYVARLANQASHQDALVEMIPASKVSPAVQLKFEIAGLGEGNRTVDWVIQAPNGPTVLLDVKNRSVDFIRQAEKMAADELAQRPGHDPIVIFSSVEQKFLPANPDRQLQGVWICTRIKQQEQMLNIAFSSLCRDRVHFAILGDWKSDAYVLARRPEDQQFLYDLFNLQPSTRFTFQ